MSKPIPVFKFAFLAFALTAQGRSGYYRRRQRSGAGDQRPVSPAFLDNAEANRFAAAWRVAPSERNGFTVCVRASRLANAPGLRLLTGADASAGAFEYVWLDEIEEHSGGFVGRARLAVKQRVPFALSNIVHWAVEPKASLLPDLFRSEQEA